MGRAVTRPFSEIVQERVGRDAAYVMALLEEAMRCFMRGETTVARGHVRDVIKGSIGYAELARRTGTPETSLIRMFGPNGNPTFENVANVLTTLQDFGGIDLQVNAITRKKRAVRAQAASRREPKVNAARAGRPAR